MTDPSTIWLIFVLAVLVLVLTFAFFGFVLYTMFKIIRDDEETRP